MGRARERGHKGQGSVYWDEPNQRWRAVIVLSGRRFLGYGATKAAAIAERNRLVRDAEKGLAPTTNALTVAACLDHYLTRVVPTLRGKSGRELSPQTVARYRWAVDRAKDGLGRKRVAKLTARQVEEFLDLLRDEGLGVDSITRVRDVLVASLREAVNRREAEHNAASASRMPSGIAPRKRRGSLSAEDAERLYRECETERNGAVIGLMVRLGLRPGEATGFYWDDLDGSVLHVRRGLRRTTGGGTEVVPTLKTANSERRLDLPDDLLAMLHRHRKQQARNRLAAERWEDDRLMFASTVGTPLDSDEVKRILSRLAERLDLTIADPVTGPRRPLPYELRHSVASLLIDRGASSVEVADLLGNSERIVAEVYRHRTRPSVDVARRLDWRTAQGE